MREAVVLAQEGAHGAQLVGYVVPITSELAPDWRDVLRECTEGLPAGIHGACAIGGARTVAADAQRQDRPQGLAEAGCRRTDAGIRAPADRSGKRPGAALERGTRCRAGRFARQLLRAWRRFDPGRPTGGENQAVACSGLGDQPARPDAQANHRRVAGVAVTCRESAGELEQGLEQVPPLFCIHGIFGTAFDYLPFARRMEGRRTVIGIQSPLLSGYRPEGLAMRELARQYAGLIRQRQPQGPYSLMGWSLGAVISLFVARELEKQGEEVVFLGLADAPLVDGREEAIRSWARSSMSSWRYSWGRAPGFRPRRRWMPLS